MKKTRQIKNSFCCHLMPHMVNLLIYVFAYTQSKLFSFEIVMNGRQFIIPELAGNGLNGANSCVHKILFNCL